MFSEGIYPFDLVFLENTSMTLTEVDNLKKTNPKRYYEYFFFIQAKMRKEREAIEKSKEQSGSGEKDTLTFKDDIPEDFVSEIGEMEDE